MTIGSLKEKKTKHISNDLDDIDHLERVLKSDPLRVNTYNDLVKDVSKRIKKREDFEYYDTICRQVANRIPNITTFAQQKDIIVFVSGKKSSNGRVLFEHCKSINPDTFLVSAADEVENLQLDLTKTIGICGATSTPSWLMENIAEKLREMTLKQTEK